MEEVTGTVKWFDDEKGFGYITPDRDDPDGPPKNDVFVHFSNVDSSIPRGTLVERQKVRFILQTSSRGVYADMVKAI